MKPTVINLKEKFSLFDKHWSPKIIGDVNDFQVKIVKIKGDFVWHNHEKEDELFMVIKGGFTIKLRDRDLELDEGELVVIPKGVEHMPVAEKEAHLLVFERNTTLNSGNVRSDKTVDNPERI